MKISKRLFVSLIIFWITFLSYLFYNKHKQIHSDILLYDTVTYVDSFNLTPFQKSWEYYGVKEFSGREHNSVILAFFNDIKANVTDDETAWCSGFMNSMSIRTGYEFSNSLVARSWLRVGESTEPYPGCIVVLWRQSPDSWKGHVGYFLRYNEDKTKVLIYGGNQSNSVVPQWYPSNRVLDFRKIKPLDSNVSDIEISEDLIKSINLK